MTTSAQLGDEHATLELEAPPYAARGAQFDARVFPIDDLEVLRAEQGGDGRTVRAYAAIYERPVIVTEFGDTYEEIVRAGAFRRTIAQRRTNFQVLFNHGRTLQGTPAERYAMPLGVPLEVTEDSRGLLTVVRYAATDLADEVLELIKAGALRGMSFSGTWVQNRLVKGVAGQLDRVERLEVAMREFGPTPFPVYEAAKIVGVRSALSALTAAERATLLAELDREQLAADDLGTEQHQPEQHQPVAASGTPAEPSEPTGPPAELLALIAANRRRRA